MPSTTRQTLRASKAWIDGRWQSAAITIEAGTITAIEPDDATGNSGQATGGTQTSAGRVTDIAPEAVLLPGLVDSHVHINEPGRTEWEGFDTATRAAAAAGVTTLVDMPLNAIPPTTTVEALELKRACAAKAAGVDIGFWGGAVPENLGNLGPLVEAGVFGFKCFLSPSGVDEFGHLSPDQFARAMDEVADLGTTMIVHAEDPELLTGSGPLGTGYQAFLESRPPSSEHSAIERLINEARRTGARTHILHLSDASALPVIREAKSDGVPLTVETCPHYLTISAEEIPDGGVEFKCCPPIREASNRDALWQGVLDGTIDAIVSDHSPSTIAIKRQGDGDFGLAWGGIAGLQLGLSSVWTAATERGIALEELLPLFTTGPARVAGAQAGVITVGAPAHLATFEPEHTFVADVADLAHRNPMSAYHGRTMTGRIRQTWVHGETVYTDELTDHAAPEGHRGQLLRKATP